ncbi:HNH endonuclease signature motif containing protein [Streptomyces sp. NPDC013953]|uniref:HNH endonuclease signature motif containing protein n=1 Tax=Streptomyces sp. NPDC013953 TaxID=3364868 RepID=UPI0036F921E8
MSDAYGREELATAVAAASGWADLMRRLGVRPSGGRRRALQKQVAGHGLGTSHFKRLGPGQKYSDQAIAEAVAASTTLRQVALRLGAAPATGTLSHLRRRIRAAGLDVSHMDGMNRERVDLPFTVTELEDAVRASDSIRGAARALGLPDDGRSRAALGRMLQKQGIDTRHFRGSRVPVPEEALRDAVPKATSYAAVMRALGLPVNDTNHRRVRRKVAQLGLDTSHFTRRTWGSVRVVAQRSVADRVLRVHPPGSARVNRDRLHRALQEIGVLYRCVSCGNTGEWLGRPLTLQIDHVSGDWLDNRAVNLRYLCPNCHALTGTWCRNRKGGPSG